MAWLRSSHHFARLIEPIVSIFAESGPGGRLDDYQLRPRERDRLHEAVHEPRHLHSLQGKTQKYCKAWTTRACYTRCTVHRDFSADIEFWPAFCKRSTRWTLHKVNDTPHCQGVFASSAWPKRQATVRKHVTTYLMLLDARIFNYWYRKKVLRFC